VRSHTHGPSSPRHSPRRGVHQWSPVLVGHPMRGQADTSSRSAHRGPSIPSTESAREQSLGDDLFHEPEAQPKFVTAEAPPETTVGGHHCGKWLPSVIQAGLC